MGIYICGLELFIIIIIIIEKKKKKDIPTVKEKDLLKMNQILRAWG